MRFMSTGLLLGLFFVFGLAGCGGNDAVIPDNPTKGPASGPSKDGLPVSKPMAQ